MHGKPSSKNYGPVDIELPQRFSGQIRQVAACLHQKGQAGGVPALGCLHDKSRALRPKSPPCLSRMEECNELVWVVNSAGFKQCRGELIRFEALVHSPEAVADSLPAKPVAAAFVSQEVSPASGPGFFAGLVPAPGRGSCATNDSDARAGAPRSKQQP